MHTEKPKQICNNILITNNNFDEIYVQAKFGCLTLSKENVFLNINTSFHFKKCNGKGYECSALENYSYIIVFLWQILIYAIHHVRLALKYKINSC